MGDLHDDKTPVGYVTKSICMAAWYTRVVRVDPTWEFTTLTAEHATATRTYEARVVFPARMWAGRPACMLMAFDELADSLERALAEP